MRTITLILLAVFSTGAMAEWTYLGLSSIGNSTFDVYIDKATIRKQGNVVKMWELYTIRVKLTQ